MKADDWGKHRIDIWALALSDLQITEKEFIAARRKSLTLSWPPTAPADFLGLGRGDLMDNYTNTHKAYIDAAHHRWDDEGILYETAKLVGLSAMRELPEIKTYPMWQKHYPEVCKRHSQGLIEKPKQVVHIEEKKQSQACSEETANYYLNEIRALLAENKSC